MDVGWYYKLFVLAILLVFSAFFSGSEVALFSLDKKKVKELKKDSKLIGEYVQNLLDFPRRLLVTILIGNTLFNVGASILSVELGLEFARLNNYPLDLILIIQIILLTILILIFGEITPKVWASKYPFKFTKVIAVPLYWISVLIYPIAKIITDIIKAFASKINFDRARTALATSDLGELADIGVEKGTIEEDEHHLIHGLVEFKEITAREVMTPRVDITAVSSDASFEEVRSLITESGHSRIPLFEGNLDNVTGIIYAKDLLPYLGNGSLKSGLDLTKIARKAMFIPESKLINELMHEFQEKNKHMGIVVDEYGGTAGLVSLEDILEEIVGEIRDEYDKEENEITKISENSYLVLGKVPIDELNELLESDFSSENDDYDTVGGFIFNTAGKIPDEGYTFLYEIFRFTVKDVINNRINSVLVEKTKESAL